MGLFGNKNEDVHVISYDKDEQLHTEHIVTESIKPKPLPQAMGDIYLIDFENVHDEGLHGIETLSPEDKVVVFYGSLNKMISLDTHLSVLQSKAQIENLQIGKSAKNYLDFQLVTYLGYLLGTGNYKAVYIISKDSGFDSVVDFWNARNITIARRSAIVVQEKPQTLPAKKQAKPQTLTPTQKKEPAKQPAPQVDVPEATRKKIRTALQNQKLSGSNYMTIYRAFSASKDKNAYDISLRKGLGQEKGADVYAATKLIWNEWHGANL